MNNLKIINFYIKKIKNLDHLKIRIDDNLFCGYKNIVSYLNEVVFLKDYYTYDNLMEAADIRGSEENILLDLVYILTDRNIDILMYRFEVYDEESERMIGVNAERVFRAYMRNEFFHPISGRHLSFKEFNDEIIPFFSTTESFKMKVKQDGNV